MYLTEYSCYNDSLIIPDKLDDSIHIAAAKALQRMAKIQGNED